MAQSEIPDAFLGSFKLERSENFDELLASKGVNWVLRKMIQLSSVTKVFSLSDDGEKYVLHNKTSRKTMAPWEFKLGEAIETEGFDGKKHKANNFPQITFTVEEEALFEKHVRIEEDGEPEETYKYTIENDYLVLHMSHGDVNARRFLKKIT